MKCTRCDGYGRFWAWVYPYPLDGKTWRARAHVPVRRKIPCARCRRTGYV